MDFDTIVNRIFKEMNNKNNHIHGLCFELPSLYLYASKELQTVCYIINYEWSSITFDIEYTPRDGKIKIEMTYWHEDNVFVEDILIVRRKSIKGREIEEIVIGFFAKCRNYYTEMYE